MHILFSHFSEHGHFKFFYLRTWFLLMTIAVSVFVVPSPVSATTYSSTNYQVQNPVLNTGAGRETSSSFILIESVGQNAIGTSTSGSFIVKSGFLYFPAPSSVSTPSDGTPPPVDVSNVPIHILPFIRPLVPDITPEQAEEIISQLPCRNGVIAEDLNCDGIVDLVDLSIFLYLAGPEQKNRIQNPADFNRDGTVTFADLSILFSKWTRTFIPGLDASLSDNIVTYPTPKITVTPEEEEELFYQFVTGISKQSESTVNANNEESLQEQYISLTDKNGRKVIPQTAQATRGNNNLPAVGWGSVFFLVGFLFFIRFLFYRFGF